MEIPSFVKLIEASLVKNWDRDALTDFKGATLQYHDVARKIEKLHILHEFTADQMHNIVNHSDAKLLFVGDVVATQIDPTKMPGLEGIIYIPDYSLVLSRTDKLTYAREHLNEMFGKKFPKYFRKEHVSYKAEDSANTMAMINYTSGTTGFSKGVMIPYRALWSNYDFANNVLADKLSIGDNVISILPMAHMYGMAFEFLFEFLTGLHIFYLSRIPSPAIIAQAFSEVKPKVIIAVPLVIEKIINKKVNEKICEQVRAAFGGQFYEVIIGGAAFNKEVELFLHRIGFQYTVGYGATECAPIISYADYKTFVPGSCGRPVVHMEVKIDSHDPENVPGEILARGLNVMLGYYKNEEATQNTLDKEGWYHTGDLGTMDAEGNIFIKGRSKNMLLSSNGQNIYPEEIEDQLNSLPMVMESVVVQRGDKLAALVHPDFEEAKTMGLSTDDLQKLMEENRTTINAELPAYSKITEIEIHEDEFEKTPKKSIKRYLYK